MDGSRIDIGRAPPPPPPPAVALRVLVVDDSAAQRRLMAAVLTRMGLNVIQASCPREALWLCTTGAEGPVGMIISDWQMPDMDGPDLCRALREIGGDRYIYFILMTAGEHRSGGLDAGADDYLKRPVDMAELRARVRAGLRMLAMQESLLHRNHEVATTLHDLQAIQDATNRDLVEARRLQQSYLPPERAAYPGARLRLRLITQGSVGGDLMGYADLGDGRVALYSIDVSGHGIASAMLTGRLSGIFRAWNPAHSILFSGPGGAVAPPEAVISKVNEIMLDRLDTDLYFTIALAYLDLATGALEFCQAGHPHPIVRRVDGTVEVVGEGGPPVGLLPGAPFERCHARLAPGDALVLYSDGLTECEDTWGDMLEEAGLVGIVGPAGADPETAVDAIVAGVEAFAGIADFDDDVSILHLVYDGPPAPAR